MKIILPIQIDDSTFVSSNAVDLQPLAYAAGTSYTLGEHVLYSGVIYTSIYEGFHTGNQPDISPDFWVASNVTATPTYSAGTTYATGDRVIVDATHRIYESLQDANTGNYPPSSLEGDTPFWVEVGATNLWSAFDSKVSRTTLNEGSLTFTLLPGNKTTGIALLNLKAQAVNLIMTDPSEGEVYNETLELINNDNIYDWYTYFFEDFLLLDSMVKTDLPPYRNPTIYITVIAETPSTEVEVGELIIGDAKDLGFTQYTPDVGIIDYSTKEVDEFGNYSILERSFSKRTDLRVIVETSKVNNVYRILSNLRATPVLWVGTENPLYSSTLLIYGYYKDFSMVIPHPIWAEMDLQIEGLT